MFVLKIKNSNDFYRFSAKGDRTSDINSATSFSTFERAETFCKITSKHTPCEVIAR